MNYYLSIDAGTSIIKSVLFNKTFELVCITSVENKILTDQTGKSEIEMNKFWSLTSKCIKSCILQSKVNPLNIDAIGITGNMVGAWPIDKANKPIRNAILWNDTRSAKEALKLDQIDKVRQLSGNIVFSGFTAPKLAWLQKNEFSNCWCNWTSRRRSFKSAC